MVSSQHHGCIAVVHGTIPPHAPPDEQDVLVEAAAVCRALREGGYSVQTVTFGTNVRHVLQRLSQLEPAGIFNLVESVNGRDSLMPVAAWTFESTGIPYTGVPAPALGVTTHKGAAKKRMHACSIPTPNWTAATTALQSGIPWQGPCIVKSMLDHASIGLDDEQVFADASGARAYLRHLPPHRIPPLMVESFIDGREFNLSLIETPQGVRVLPPAEMQFIDFPPQKPRIVGYRAKWDPGDSAYHTTVRTFARNAADEALVTALASIALRCWDAFALRGYCRVDLRVDANGNPFVLEINANPSLSPDAGFPAAALEGAIDYRTLVCSLVPIAGGCV